MALQLIICVESNARAATDNIYIKETIGKYYVIDNSIKISFINMDGKSKYKSTRVRTKIKQLCNDYMIGESKVIYCFDTDKYEVNPDQDNENKEIQVYLMENGYDYVWFCHDIEEVYLHESVENSAKTKRAIEFKTGKTIETIKEKSLLSNNIAKQKSNILMVLDKYLVRKEGE